jgi:hypothetical protein
MGCVVKEYGDGKAGNGDGKAGNWNGDDSEDVDDNDGLDVVDTEVDVSIEGVEGGIGLGDGDEEQGGADGDADLAGAEIDVNNVVDGGAGAGAVII